MILAASQRVAAPVPPHLAKRPEESLQELQRRVSAAAKKVRRSQRAPTIVRKATRPTTCKPMQLERVSAMAVRSVVDLREGVSPTAARA